MVKKCFLEGLPKKYGFGNNSNREIVDWQSSIGYAIPFQYKEVIGELKVLDYNSKKQRLTIEYNGKQFPIATSQILRCGLGSIVGEFNKDYIYGEGQILENNGSGIIVGRFRKGKDNIRHYNIECLKCNNIYDRSEGHLKDRGVKCPLCGDGISYPNKFINSLLLQLGCNFEKEFIIDETSDKRYDFYIKDINTIIEVHGKQHYADTGFSACGGRTLEEEQLNDKLKEENARSKGYEYIIIDARNSEMQWIRNSVLHSKLIELYDLSIVNWEQCDEFAVGSLTMKICSMFKEGDSSITNKIAKELGISRFTVVKHLKRGVEFGWCNYDPIKIQTLNAKDKNKSKAKPIVCNETGQEFESATECARVSLEVFGVKMLASKIGAVCRGENKNHRGYTFRFLNVEGGEEHCQVA